MNAHECVPSHRQRLTRRLTFEHKIETVVKLLRLFAYEAIDLVRNVPTNLPRNYYSKTKW